MNGLYITDFSNPSIKVLGEERVEPCPGADLPAGTRAFSAFFAPTLEQAPRYYWLTDGWESSPFVELFLRDNGEQLYDQLAVPGAQGPLFRPGILPFRASYLYDDWCNLVGLEKPQEDAVERARQIMTHPDETQNYELVCEHSPLAFYCIDGRSWEIYARDADLLAATARHVRSLGPFTIEPCNLMTRDLDRFAVESAERPREN